MADSILPLDLAGPGEWLKTSCINKVIVMANYYYWKTDTNHHVSLPHSKGSGQTIEFIFTFTYIKRTHYWRQFVLVYYDDTVNGRNITKEGIYYIDNCWHALPHHNNPSSPVSSIAPVEEFPSHRYAPLSWLSSHDKCFLSWALWEGQHWHSVFAVSTELSGDRGRIQCAVGQTYRCTWRWSDRCWWQSRRGI